MLGVKPLLIADRWGWGEASVGHKSGVVSAYYLQRGWRMGELAIGAQHWGLAFPGQPLLL